MSTSLWRPYAIALLMQKSIRHAGVRGVDGHDSSTERRASSSSGCGEVDRLSLNTGSVRVMFKASGSELEQCTGLDWGWDSLTWRLRPGETIPHAFIFVRLEFKIGQRSGRFRVAHRPARPPDGGRLLSRHVALGADLHDDRHQGCSDVVPRETGRSVAGAAAEADEDHHAAREDRGRLDWMHSVLLPSDRRGNEAHRTLGYARSVAWAPPPWITIGAAGPDQQTSDLTRIVSQIVGRSGWVSGNSMVLLFTGSGHRTAESFEGDALGAPALHVEYLEAATPPPVAVGETRPSGIGLKMLGSSPARGPPRFSSCSTWRGGGAPRAVAGRLGRGGRR